MSFITYFQVWFQNRRAKWRKSERFTQRQPSSKDAGENPDEGKSDNEAEDPDVCGDISEPEPEERDEEHFKREKMLNDTENSDELRSNNCTENNENNIESDSFTEKSMLPQTAAEKKVVMATEDITDQTPEDLTSSSSLKTDTDVKTPPAHLIHNIVSMSDSVEQTTESQDPSQPKTHTDDNESLPVRSAGSPSSQLASLALVNTARASMMMNSKPMLQHSFTQTLMALSNNAMNRPSFFPMLDR